MSTGTIIEKPVQEAQTTDAVQLVDEMNEQSFQWRHTDPVQSAALAHRALHLATKTGYHLGRGNALLNIGFQELTKTYYDKAFQALHEALQIFQNVNDQSRCAHAYYYHGLVYLRLGDYDNAMQVFQESVRIRKELNDEEGIFTCRSHTAFINSQFGQEETAIREYKECIAFWQKPGSESNLAAALRGFAVVEIKLNQLQQAKAHLIKAIHICRNLNELTGWAGAINYLCDVYLMQGKAAQARTLLEEALGIMLAQPQPFAAIVCRLRTNLAKVHAQLLNYSEAARNLHEALELAIKTKQQYQLHNIYLELAQFYKTTNQFEKALTYYEKFHTAKEAVVNLNAATRMKNMEMHNKVEMREKEAEIHRLKNIELKKRNKIIQEERKKSEALLLNILPSSTAKELKKHGVAKTRRYELTTVLFTDFVDFTHTSEGLSPETLVRYIDTYFRAFDDIISRHHLEKIKTIGDAYMAAGGVPVANTTNPVDVVKAGLEIVQYVRAQNNPLFRIRVGINTGTVVAGIVGSKKFAYDIWGDAVNVASRMESSGAEGRVNISGATYELVKPYFKCLYRGKVEAKRKGMIDMYFVDET